MMTFTPEMQALIDRQMKNDRDLYFNLNVNAGRKERVCNNPKCGKSFGWERINRRFCSNKCANSTRIREFRRAARKAKG